MTLPELAACFFALTAAISAILILATRNVLYGALSLIACLLSMSAIFIVLYAEFLAIVQIIIYAAGVVILIIFGIMLTARTGTSALLVQSRDTFMGVLISSLFFGILIFSIRPYVVPVERQPDLPNNHVTSIGTAMLTTHSLPFETAGILMLMSLVAAAVIASDHVLKQNKK